MGYDYWSKGGGGSGTPAEITGVRIINNGLTLQITAKGDSTSNRSYDFYVIVQGEKIKVPVYLNVKI